MKINEILYAKTPGLFLILSTIKRVIKRDKKYIKDHNSLYGNPSIIFIEHGGNINNNKVIYVINEQGEGYGFFAELKILLSKIMYADDLGFEPCVIFGKKYLYFDTSMCKNNAFDYYFESLGSVDDSMESVNIVRSEASHLKYIEAKYNITGYIKSMQVKTKFAEMVKKYIHLKNEILDDIEKFISGANKKKILGIHYRGTDYKMNYNAHAKHVSLEQIFSEIDHCIQKFELIFLATDEEGIYEQITERYGNIVMRYDDVYKGTENKSVAFSIDNRECHHYKLGYEVLRDMYTLSMCEGLICGLSQVSFFAQVFKLSRGEEYDFLKEIDNGINKNNNNFSNAKENTFVDKYVK